MAITLPDNPSPNAASPTLIDYGSVQRPATGAAAQRIDRPGSRFRIEIGFPPMPNKETGRVFVSRLLRAKTEGLQIEMPLLGVDQGVPGSPVVDGAGQSGTTLNLRGLTPHYAAREGYWLSISNGTRRFLHNVAAPAAADATGDMTVTITPALRYPFADGATVDMAHPMIDGFVLGEEWGWQMGLDHNLGLSVAIEEWG